MEERTRAQLLAAVLADRSASVEERDDAATDLASFDEPAVQRALMACATDAEEHHMIQATAGESLGEIWVRTGVFLPERLAALAAPARAEAEAVIRRLRPAWLLDVEQ